MSELPERCGTNKNVYLRFSVTDTCNLHCTYCRPAGVPAQHRTHQLSSDSLLEIIAILNSVLGLRKIRFTGGEPLTRKDIVDLVSRVSATVPDSHLCMTTNGILLRQYAESLRDAGLHRINISLDSVDHSGFLRSAGTAHPSSVISGITAARDAGLTPIKINSVLLRSINGDQLPSLVRLAADHEAEIRFIELMPGGAGAAIYDRDHLPASEALEILSRTFQVEGPIGNSDTAVRYTLRDGSREVTVGFIAPVSKPFCGTCDRLRLDSRGRLHSCLRREHFIDLTKLIGKSAEEQANVIRKFVGSKVHPVDEWSHRSMVAIGG